MERLLLCALIALVTLACGTSGSREDDAAAAATDVGETGPPPAGPDAPATPDLDLSPLGQESYRILLAAERFTDDAIGYAGITPNEVIALRNLFREPDAATAFRALERRATLPGRLYALCGLYYADRARFDEVVDEYRDLETTIEFMSGCVVDPARRVREIVALPDDRAVRLAPGQSNREFLQARGRSASYDIVGGGFPNLFRDGGGYHEPRQEPFHPRDD